MAFYTMRKCSVQDCNTDVVTTQFTVCSLCEEVRCQEHDKESNHECVILKKIKGRLSREQKKEKVQQNLLKQFTILLNKLEKHRSVIQSSAQALRPGHMCTLELPSDARAILAEEQTYGSMNIHLPLVFDDGVKWLIRVRQAPHGIPPPHILEQTAISEIVTLHTLRSSGLPVPNAWMPKKHFFQDDHSDTYQEPPVCYFFYEHLSGKSVALRHATESDFREVPEKDRLLIEDFGKLQISLSNHPLPYDTIGCLQASPDSNSLTEVGPLISLWGLNRLESPHFPGPFKTHRERYLTLIDIALSHIIQQASHSTFTLDAYLWHLCLKELVETCPELAEEMTEVYVRHADSKGDILWGDEEGNLTGILDWESAYVTNKAEAFSSPVFCYNTQAPYEDQMIHTPREHVLMDFYERSNRPDLADCVRKGKKYQYLSTIGRFGGWYGISFSPWALMDAFEETRPESLQPPLHPDRDWTLYMVQRYQSQSQNPSQDSGLEDILAKVGWDMQKEKTKLRKGWEERDSERAQWWGMSIEERRVKKKKDIAERENWRSEAILQAEMRRLAVTDQNPE